MRFSFQVFNLCCFVFLYSYAYTDLLFIDWVTVPLANAFILVFEMDSNL